jgi:hypothetical protein
MCFKTDYRAIGDGCGECGILDRWLQPTGDFTGLAFNSARTRGNEQWWSMALTELVPSESKCLKPPFEIKFQFFFATTIDSQHLAVGTDATEVDGF